MATSIGTLFPTVSFGTRAVIVQVPMGRWRVCDEMISQGIIFARTLAFILDAHVSDCEGGEDVNCQDSGVSSKAGEEPGARDRPSYALDVCSSMNPAQ
jgi:hypothetical protein